MPRSLASLSGLYFNSNPLINSRVSIPNLSSLQGLSSLTVECWIYVNNSTAQLSRILDYTSGNMGFVLELNTSATAVNFIVGNSTTTASASAVGNLINGWHKVEGNWDGSNVRVFIDGNLLATVALSGGNTGNPGASVALGNSTGGTRAFPGTISEVRISNIARHTASYTPETAPLPVDANTVGLYHLNEGQGTVAQDSSTNANHGTLTGSPLPTWADGKFLGGASSRTGATARTSLQNYMASLSFNGSSTFVTAAHNSNQDLGSDDFYVGFWMKPQVPNANVQSVVAQYSGAAFANNANGLGWEVLYRGDQASKSINFRINNGGAAGTTTSAATSSLNFGYGSWHYVFITAQRASSARFYIDGAFISTSSISSITGSISSTGAFNIGRQTGTGTSDFFAGALCEVVVGDMGVNGITNPDVIAANAYQNRVYPGTIKAYYPLNEGAGSVAIDQSGLVNNGTITAGTYTLDTPSKTRGLVGGNLVYNGNFEYAPPTNVAQLSTNWTDGTSGGSATNNIFGWGIDGKTGSIAVLFDNSTSHSGNYSMKLSTTATGSQVRVSDVISGTNQTDPIAVLPSTSYTYSFWMKTTANSGSATTGAEIIFIERQSGGNSVGTNAAGLITTTTGWTQYTSSFITNSATRFITPDLRVTGQDGTGTLIMDAWFDDIVLMPTVNTARSLAT